MKSWLIALPEYVWRGIKVAKGSQESRDKPFMGFFHLLVIITHHKL